MKRLTYIILAFFLTIFGLNAKEIQDGRPKVAVVLAGGGAKGTAHLGALKVIEECGIPIDIIVGTSMGSIVGGLYSIGYTSDEILDVVRSTDWINLILDTPDYGNQLLTSKKDQENYLLRVSLDRARMMSGTSRGGIIHGKNISSLMNHLTKGVPNDIDFNSFPIAFACVATDAITGKKHTFHKGNLVTAMRSSMAIPTVFTPVKLGDMALVDGGIVDNYPVDVAREMGADIVIGIDLVSEISDDELANSALDVLMRLLDMISKKRYEDNIKNTDLYISVNTTGYSAASFNTTAIDTLINRGEDAARIKIEELRSLAERLSADTSDKTLKNRRMIGVKYDHTFDEIHDKTYADLQDSLPNNMKTAFQEGTINIGGRFDNQNYASLQMSIDVTLLHKSHVDLNIYGRLGARMVGGISFAQLYNNGGKLESRYTIEHKEYNYDYKGQRVISLGDYHHRFDIRYKREWRKVGYSFGWRYDVNRYKNILIHRDVADMDNELSRERFFTYYAKAEFNSLNSLYFPTRGTQVECMAQVITNNLYEYHGKAPVPIASAYWRTAVAITPSTTIIPHGSARLIIANNLDNIPWALDNVVGGLHREMWKEQQIEMAGLPYMEIVNRTSIGVFGLELQQRFGKNNFLVFTADGSSMSNTFNEVLGDRSIFYGFNLGYQYRGVAGPISMTGMWSSHTNKFGAVLNVGYYF